MAEIDIKRFPRIVTTKNQDNMDLKQGADLPPVTEDDNGDGIKLHRAEEKLSY